MCRTITLRISSQHRQHLVGQEFLISVPQIWQALNQARNIYKLNYGLAICPMCILTGWESEMYRCLCTKNLLISMEIRGKKPNFPFVCCKCCFVMSWGIFCASQNTIRRAGSKYDDHDRQYLDSGLCSNTVLGWRQTTKRFYSYYNLLIIYTCPVIKVTNIWFFF